MTSKVHEVFTCAPKRSGRWRKARSAHGPLLRSAMHHAIPLQHVLAVDAYRGTLRIEPLYEIERDGVHVVVVFRDKHLGIADVVVDIGTAETNVLTYVVRNVRAKNQ